MVKELDYTQLKGSCDFGEMSFDTTENLEPSDGMIGQERARQALEFGLHVKNKGYNIYISGYPGTGRTTFATAYAQKSAANEKTPPDLCYVYNFKEPKKPRLITLNAGQGKEFRTEMDELIGRLQNELPKVYNEKDFENKKTEIIREYQNKRDEIIKDMTEEAKGQNFGIKSTNSGIYFMPIVDGEMISEEQYEALSQEQRDDIGKNSEVIQAKATEVMREIKGYEKSTRKRVEDLEYSIGLFTISHHINQIMENYADNQKMLDYLSEVKEDILDSIEDFIEQDSDEEDSLQAILPWYYKKATEDAFSKYRVNLMTDNSEAKGAPVIVDFNPTYSNLVGEAEYDNEFGNLSTDFMKLKPGLLHKANGGYLILQAYDLLSSVHAWEILRRALLTREIVTEPLREFTSGVAVSTIKPEPVQLDIKVILIGSHYYYDVLNIYDEEFSKLFKISVDFDYEMDFDRKNAKELARFIKRFVEKEKTANFDKNAVIYIIEYASRLAESREKLSTRFNRITELLTEAETWASMENNQLITEEHVKKAIAEREYRLSMYEEKLSEMIEKDIIMIDTTGKKIGQINGLAILDTGNFTFAKPSRITATTYMGKSGIVNIEKEADISGNIHDKGIQVIIGYLGQTYAQNFPLSMSCRVCFEQNYSGIDGDSASSTELYAILSSLSELPINQEIAVTGSVNQRGEIQAIGGVTTKIEGFFGVCKKRGLSGSQGVMIPKQNIQDLTLKDEVIEAVRKGQFHIYSIETIDDGIELLTGVKAGKLNEKGKYPLTSVHGKVYKKLKEFNKKSISE